jgi:hypothetical protein
MVEVRREFVTKLKRNGHKTIPRLDLNDRQQPHNHVRHEIPTLYLSIPFVDDSVNTRVKRSLNALGYNIRICHKGRKLRDILYKPVTHPHTRNGLCNIPNCKVSSELCFRPMVVYEAICSSCQGRYIGSTKKFLHQRVYEHFHQHTSHIYKHNSICRGSWSFKIRCSDKSLQNLRWAEAILIKKENPTINRREENAGLLQFLA